jgi:hypothetical protein
MALRLIAEGLWVAEEPLAVLGVPAGRRMSVVALDDGALWLHSPADLTAELQRELEAIGTSRYVVAPSAIHGVMSMDQYTGVERFGGPGVARRRQELGLTAELGDTPDPRWAAHLDQALIPMRPLGGEVVFLHRSSGSLIVGDAVWNVAPDAPLRTRVWAGGRGPRITPLFRGLLGERDGVRAAIERILAWDFDRIVVGHGPMVETGGRAAFERAYRFLLR